ncbi:MAG: site-2 protease family protein [Desulforhabdus sp.]|jgi:Zn-dependent protease/predicted transcriptional regulator|nr:site-2 protease family protein [Desulforhabdus sp.]
MSAQNKNEAMKRGFNLFKIAGIQVKIDISWFIIFFLVLWSLSAGYFPRQFPGQTAHFYWFSGLVATLLFFFSVIFHELSHSFTALQFGIKIPEITLFIFGGISRLSEEAKTPGSEFKIAVAGPLSSFFLAGVFWIFQTLTSRLQVPMAHAIFGYLVWINLALGIFNLLPGFPLDGGRVLRALLWYKTGSLAKATKWASDVGKGLAVALMILGALQIFAGLLIGGLWLIFIGMFLRGVAEGGYQEVMVRQSLEGVPVREVMIEDMVTVSQDMSVSELINDYLLKYGYKGFPVTGNGHIVGIVSLAEVKDIDKESQEKIKVGEVMKQLGDSNTVESSYSLVQALQKMSAEGSARLIVKENERPVGMITKTGVVRFLEIKRILER